jgi:hypothetical protein
MEKIGEASKPLEARIAELNVSNHKVVVPDKLSKVTGENTISSYKKEVQYFWLKMLKGSVILF